MPASILINLEMKHLNKYFQEEEGGSKYQLMTPDQASLCGKYRSSAIIFLCTLKDFFSKFCSPLHGASIYIAWHQYKCGLKRLWSRKRIRKVYQTDLTIESSGQSQHLKWFLGFLRVTYLRYLQLQQWEWIFPVDFDDSYWFILLERWYFSPSWLEDWADRESPYAVTRFQGQIHSIYLP